MGKESRKKVSDIPNLLVDWDWERNNTAGIFPDKLSVNSPQKAFWNCTAGHSWEASIANRSRGTGCPVCSNRLIVPGINDLQTVLPEIAVEWNFEKNGSLLPSSVAPRSNKNVWWICRNGHEYKSVVNNRANGNGCPYCAGKKVLVGYNDFASHHPDIALEWNYEQNHIKPTEVTSGSTVRVWWTCKSCGYNWQTSVANRVKGTGCPTCARIEIGRKRRLEAVNISGSLSEKAPDIAAEWHPSRNGTLQPSAFSLKSSESVWWKCAVCGEEWKSQISNRTNGTGCPVCQKIKFTESYRKNVIQRTGSLEEKCPDIAVEWHPTKNGTLKACEVSPGCGEVVWWKCKNGHEWQAEVARRVSQRAGCPICSGRVVSKGVNDLTTTHPNIAAEWHPTRNGSLKPEDFKIGSDRIVWWRCEKGHAWKTNIYHRLQTGCPECIKEQYTSFPEQAIYFYLKGTFHNIQNRYMLDSTVELDIFLPDHSIAIEYDGARFHNSTAGLAREQRKYAFLRKKHIYLIRIKEVKDSNYLDNTADVYLGYQDNKNNRNLENIMFDLQRLLSERLNMDIQWDVNIDRDRQLIYNQYVELERENSIAVLYPQLLDEWLYEKNAPITPYMVTKGSEKSFWWKCRNGHEYVAKVKDKVRSGCPYCSNHKVLVGFNDLETVHPNLAREWIVEKNEGIKPNAVVGGKKIAWWKCPRGHEYQAGIDSRKRGSGCPVCAGKKVLEGYNDLSTTNPTLAAEWNFEKNEGLLPTQVSQYSNKKVWWKCSKLGHEWDAVIGSRTNGNGCPYCANQKVMAGYNDLQTLYPEVAKQWNYTRNDELLPSAVISGSQKAVWWKCELGHEWRASVSNRVRGSGCPVCAKKHH